MKYLMILILSLTLAACGQSPEQEEPRTGYEGSPDGGQSIGVPEGDAVDIIRDFVANELDELAFSGLYLAHDPHMHVVLLVQEDYYDEDLRERIVAFAESKGSDNLEFEIKPAKYSYQTLDTIMNKLNESYQQLLVTERQVLSFGIDEMENRIFMDVSTKADLNLDLLSEITGGNDEIIHIKEGIMSAVDENGLPIAEPFITGIVMEIDENGRILIDDQIYFSINDATVIRDHSGAELEVDDIKVGDQVMAWSDGMILHSLPAQGYAVAIKKLD
ncbi:hypothetical protein DS745_03210 [Anaerobacillus alkaliphilus]|uniref:DUF3221 domain-containing protein n=1 Tax=Anaerobacillus alkaliphilus TaxID=1548597 RepID=A0A4Q0VZE8_9BACI|nr:hypothetical protein [Anaerobacillus alkaliphilus]RXJ04408.1 hypothetical protein DS745_03210 [Anaerobacillus alkaliphilus]